MNYILKCIKLFKAHSVAMQLFPFTNNASFKPIWNDIKFLFVSWNAFHYLPSTNLVACSTKFLNLHLISIFELFLIYIKNSNNRKNHLYHIFSKIEFRCNQFSKFKFVKSSLNFVDLLNHRRNFTTATVSASANSIPQLRNQLIIKPH